MMDSLEETTSENVVQVNETEDTYEGIGRSTFFWELVGLNIIGTIIFGLAEISENVFFQVLPGIWIFVGLFFVFLVTQSRLVNIGYSQWWALLWWVPIFNLLLLLGCIILPEGYKDSHKFDYTGLILLAIFIVVCLALVAIIVASS